MFSKKKAQCFWDYYSLLKITDVIYAKEPSSMIKRIKRSLSKRMLELALWPYRDELKKQQKNFEKDFSFMESEPIYQFFYQNNLIRIFLPQYKTDDLQDDIVRRKEFHEEDLLRYISEHYKKDNMVIIDCGANIGNHTIYFNKIMNAKKVISFEGNPDTYKTLLKNIEINNMEDVVETYNYVLGEKSSMASIDHFDESNIGGTSFCENENGTLKMISVDSLNIQDHIDFIKMDVEGFEYHVLKGMTQLLNRDKPVLWIEIFPDKYKKVTELLFANGYRLQDSLRGSNYIFVAK